MAQTGVFKRGDTWYISYYVDGRQVKKKIGKSEKEAIRARRAILSSVDKGAYQELKQMGFAEFAQKWVNDYARGSVKPSTLRSYLGLLNCHLIPYFGNAKLTSIQTDTCQGYVSAKGAEGKISAKTINNSLVVLKELLKYAVVWGYLGSNPAHYVKKPRVEHREMDFLSPAEIQIFLEKNEPKNPAAADYAETYKRYAMFATAALTGVRRGELVALFKGDLNWATGHLHVRRSIYKPSWLLKKEFTSPKSAYSVRAISMSPTLQKILRQYLLLAPQSEHDLLFCTNDGGPIDGDTLTKRDFVNALRRSGLRRIRLHDLRHTFASSLIAIGEHPKFIQSQLGHSSIQTTMDRYGHLMSDTCNGSGAKLDALIFGAAQDQTEPHNPKISPNPPVLAAVR